MTVRLSDGRAIYVEPMAFARSSRSRVLAGGPVYPWKPRDESRPLAHLDSSETFIGAVFDHSGRVSGLPKPPLDGFVTDVRLLEDGDGYAAIFALTDEPKAGPDDPPLRGYWFGRTDGRTWRSLEQLPLPVGAALNTREASRLIRIGSALMIAAPFGPEGRRNVAVFERTASSWRIDTVTAPMTAYVALTVRGTEAFLYVVRPDASRSFDANSLSLFVRASGSWVDHGFLVRGGQQPILHPAVVEHDGVQTLSWIERNTLTLSHNARAARILPNGSLGPAVTLARGIEDVFPVHDATSSSRWVVSGTSNGQRTLALVQWELGEPEIHDVVVNPFTGPVLAHQTSEGDVVIGPVVGHPPREELVVSGVLRFSPRCRSGTLGGTA